MADKTPTLGFKPNADMIASIATKVVMIVGTMLLGRNLLTQDQLNELVGAVPALIGAVGVIAPILYGIWKTARPQKIAAAAALPGATVVLASQTEADKHPSESVVGPDDAKVIPVNRAG